MKATPIANSKFWLRLAKTVVTVAIATANTKNHISLMAENLRLGRKGTTFCLKKV